MRICIVDNGTRYITNLQKLLVGHEVRVADFGRGLLDIAQDTDLFVLSGGHKFSALEHPEVFANELALIRACPRPIIGICLGFELISLAFGAQLANLPKQEKGVVEITVTEPDSIFGGRMHFGVFENHRVAMLAVPNALVPLARSEDGVEVARHIQLPIYGFQFHPEVFTDKTYGDEVFLRTVELLTGPAGDSSHN